MHRYFIYFSYNGKNYHGWQIQPNASSVQQTLNEAMSRILRTPIETLGAGRTDTGVHASMMVAHFDVEQPLEDIPKLIYKLNSLLPFDIAVQNIRKVKQDANARFAALSRTYKYYIGFNKNPFNADSVCRVYTKNIDFKKMQQAADLLKLHTDFTSFSKLHTDVKTNNCTVMQAEWIQQDEDVWYFQYKANRFLRNMVRATVGTLLDVGIGKLSVQDFENILNAKNRCLAGDSMPAHALFLVDIEYPDDIFE